MNTLHLDYSSGLLNYQDASFLARNAAIEQRMQEPTIISWHRKHDMTPYYDGADPETWWEKYGAGNGGRLEVSIGDEYEFVMMDTRAFETVGEVPLRNLRDAAGQQYLCFTPLLKGAKTPNLSACSPLDDWTADQY